MTYEKSSNLGEIEYYDETDNQIKKEEEESGII